MDHSAVLDFWFSRLNSKDWYKKDKDLDNLISENFLETYNQAIKGELFLWRNTIKGRLAEIIVLDQFSRNMFRDKAQAFQFDPLALVLAQEASQHKDIDSLDSAQRAFVYMPFMHSESLLIHEKAVELFSAPGLEYNLKFELKHKVIIEKFGRYPHRNSILGRVSTPEEIEFLKGADSSF